MKLTLQYKGSIFLILLHLRKDTTDVKIINLDEAFKIIFINNS